MRYADYPVVPWKNGRGVTREIARHPERGDFAWRVSLAEMPVEAEFSVFAGVHRQLGVVEGVVELEIAGRSERCATGGPPLDFEGDEPVTGRPVGGPAVDINLMTRGSDATLLSLSVGTHDLVPSAALLTSLIDGLVVVAAGRLFELDRLDSLAGIHDSVSTLDLSAPGDTTGPVAYLAQGFTSPS